MSGAKKERKKEVNDSKAVLSDVDTAAARAARYREIIKKGRESGLKGQDYYEALGGLAWLYVWEEVEPQDTDTLITPTKGEEPTTLYEKAASLLREIIDNNPPHTDILADAFAKMGWLVAFWDVEACRQDLPSWSSATPGTIPKTPFNQAAALLRHAITLSGQNDWALLGLGRLYQASDLNSLVLLGPESFSQAAKHVNLRDAIELEETDFLPEEETFGSLIGGAIVLFQRALTSNPKNFYAVLELLEIQVIYLIHGNEVSNKIIPLYRQIIIANHEGELMPFVRYLPLGDKIPLRLKSMADYYLGLMHYYSNHMKQRRQAAGPLRLARQSDRNNLWATTQLLIVINDDLTQIKPEDYTSPLDMSSSKAELMAAMIRESLVANPTSLVASDLSQMLYKLIVDKGVKSLPDDASYMLPTEIVREVFKQHRRLSIVDEAALIAMVVTSTAGLLATDSALLLVLAYLLPAPRQKTPPSLVQLVENSQLAETGAAMFKKVWSPQDFKLFAELEGIEMEDSHKHTDSKSSPSPSSAARSAPPDAKSGSVVGFFGSSRGSGGLAAGAVTASSRSLQMPSRTLLSFESPAKKLESKKAWESGKKDAEECINMLRRNLELPGGGGGGALKELTDEELRGRCEDRWEQLKDLADSQGDKADSARASIAKAADFLARVAPVLKKDLSKDFPFLAPHSGIQSPS